MWPCSGCGPIAQAGVVILRGGRKWGTPQNLGLGGPEQQLSLDGDALGGQQRGREAFREATGCARPRTHYWEGARKQQKWVGPGSLSVLSLGSRISWLLSARNPHRPHPGKAPPDGELTSLSVSPSCTGELSSSTAGEPLAQVSALRWELRPPDSQSSGFPACFHGGGE